MEAALLRLVQVGIGGFGSSWASSVVPSVEGVEPVGYVDRDGAALDRVVESGLADRRLCFTSLDDALLRAQPDAVLVTTPVEAHIPLAKVALAAGKHVLVEKPFGTSVAEAQAAVAAAQENDRILMVSQNYRFHPAVRAVQRIVQDKRLGQLHGIALDFRKNVRKGPPRPGRVPLAHPLLADMSIHHFDLMRAVTGTDVSEIDCRVWKLAGYPFVGPPAGSALLTMADGVVISYRGNWVSCGPATAWAGEWVMDFSDGQLVWTSRDGQTGAPDRATIRRADEPDEQVELPDLAYIDRAGSLAAFVEAVRTGQEPETSGARNVASLAVTYAAIESAEARRPVLLP